MRDRTERGYGRPSAAKWGTAPRIFLCACAAQCIFCAFAVNTAIHELLTDAAGDQFEGKTADVPAERSSSEPYDSNILARFAAA